MARERTFVAAITVYDIGFFGVLAYLLVTIWPLPSNGTTSPFSTWTILGTGFLVSDEVRLIILVLVIGALGAVSHSLWALYLHVSARKDFDRRWAGWYVARPFVGALFGLLFYLVLRAGLFSPGTTGSVTNPFGFATVAGLVGFFSEEALEKLRQIAEDLFAKVPNEAPSTGSKVAETGTYVFLHEAGASCAKPYEIKSFAEGESFPACTTCGKPGTWRLVEKPSPP